MDNFSHESKCPNQYSLNSFKKEEQCNPNNIENTWNPFGTDLLHENFPFPLYYISDANEIKKLIDCFDKFNNFDYANQNYRSLCSIQINTFMSASVNSEVCVRRTNTASNLHPPKFCDPLQGKNVYATLFPREIVPKNERTVKETEKFILISTSIDTTSLFDGKFIHFMHI